VTLGALIKFSIIACGKWQVASVGWLGNVGKWRQLKYIETWKYL